MSKVFRAHLALLLLNVLYTISYFVVKGACPQFIPASGFVFIRATGASILFWTVASFLKEEKVAPSDLKKMAFASIFGVVINQLSFFHGLVFTSTVNTAIIMTTTPLMALLLAYMMLREKIGSRKLLGIVIGFTGALIIILQNKKGAEATNPMLGNSLIFINALAFTYYLVYIKPMMLKYSLFTVLKWVFLFGALALLPIGFPGLLEVNWNFPPEIWLSIVYVVVGITFLTFVLNMFALKELSPSVVTSYIFCQPVFTAILAYFIEGKVISVSSVIATLLIFLGVYFVSIKRS